jgi:GNAT superfamily N-acetyltransferase
MSRLRLDEKEKLDFLALSREEGFPCELTDEVMALLVKNATGDAFLLFGEYSDGRLAAIGALSIFFVFPCPDSPCGLIGHISGVYTHPEYRHQGLSAAIVDQIIDAGREAGCDYVCLDSTADELYRKAGFIHAPENETRMWLPLHP